ncbi:AMP-binding protein [Xenorhabdus doucetiae]|uniref:Acyl-CoA synthetase (AMP-forming)/AMP-acid ligase II n=1 Tax=Xenorhabdus doucetiae TaxID=351671 RepID=A0A068QU22_9GAMM|nr:AMP-binding protein [Xenorhabdus doucetiae]TYP02463.1 acyl-CoA synthetase (AMP-forming)/AMP-acid ligase II [Xenorhabdus doucetiae]CDG18151.1 putative Benzoate--CoA ligase [Xenorhabdus doucetiae]
MKSIYLKESLKNDYLNLTDFLVFRNIREGRGDNVAISYNGKIFTYQELSEKISKTSNYFKSIGIKNKTRVILAIPDTPAFVINFFAVIACNAMAILSNPLSELVELNEIVKKTNAEVLIIDHEIEKNRELSLKITNGIRTIFTGDFHLNPSSLEIAIENQSKDFLNSYTSADNYAYALLSSGTTGKTKVIPRRHRDILHCAYAFSENVLHMNSTDRVLAVPKLTFGYALGGVLLFSFIYGASCIIFREKTTCKKIMELSEGLKPTIFLGTPRMISELLSDKRKNKLTSLRISTSAGEVLSPILLEKWSKEIGSPLLDGFGSTEVGHIFLSNTQEDIKPQTAGKCLSGFQIKIIDEKGNEVNEGGVGRLCIRGPSVACEYLNDAERSKQSFNGGWHISNDMFSVYNDYFTYFGRADDMIKKGCGEWISPYEIENEILKNDEVLECAVIGETNKNNVIKLIR